MSEKATITAMREWLKTCPLIAEEQSENGAAFRISGLSPEPVAEFSIEDSPTDPVTAVFFSGRNLAKSYSPPRLQRGPERPDREQRLF